MDNNSENKKLVCKKKGINMDKIKNEILAAYLSGECTKDEKEKFEKWLQSDPAHQKEYDLLIKTIQASRKPEYNWDTEKLWDKIARASGIAKTSNTIPFTHKIMRSPVWRIAAVFLILLSIPIIYTQVIQPYIQSQQMESVYVEFGQKEKLLLPDGSAVTLDAGSSLSYQPEFSGNIREVYLSGEGFFDITSNPDKPFIVHANHAAVRVLGTKFNVRAWRNSKRVTLAVAEGKVSFTNEKFSKENSVILTKNQVSIMPDSIPPLQPQTANLRDYLGWMNDEIIFNNTPLHEIISQIERWYNIQIEIENKQILDEQLTLNIQKKPIEEVLGIITGLTDLKYRWAGNVVYLH